jgi:hypothetical protein
VAFRAGGLGQFQAGGFGVDQDHGLWAGHGMDAITSSGDLGHFFSMWMDCGSRAGAKCGKPMALRPDKRYKNTAKTRRTTGFDGFDGGSTLRAGS